MTNETKPTNAERIWEGIMDLRNAGKKISRNSISQLTGLKLQIVDDHVDRMIADDKLCRAGNGELVVIQAWREPRPITLSELADGEVVLEIGDAVNHLTPAEARKLARLTAGYGRQLQEIEEADKALLVTHALARRLWDVGRRIDTLESAAKPSADEQQQQSLKLN